METIDDISLKMDDLAVMVARYFANLNPSSCRDLPQAMTVIFQKECYSARLAHAEVGHYNEPLKRRPEPHRHDYYHFILITGGQGHFFIDGKTHSTSLGQVWLTGPDQWHQFLNSGQDSTRYAEVTFEMINRRGRSLQLRFEEMLAVWTNQPCKALAPSKLSPGSMRLLEGKLEHLIETGRTQATNLELNIQLAEILMHIFLNAFQPVEPVPSQSLDSLRDYIRTHYQQKLSLPDLALRVHLTPNYLSRHFKELYGQTPIDYQIDLRIRSACGLLKTVNDTLDQIARHVGFDDVYYFSRVFTKRIGQSPGRYRASRHSSAT
jgi:AraC-like DNA-binding protein/mannose-6-phosphate isomerase-like protein (cupin superfamily)